MNTIFSIGHSSHDWPTFRRLLEIADIGVVVDVRSHPASRLPHFNRGALKQRLNAAGVGYDFLGRELGGRPKGDGDVLDYERIAASPLFGEGVARVEQMAARTRPALMCSEREPLACHRCLLVGRRLAERGDDLAHILGNGAIEPNADTEDRLVALAGQANADLFSTRSERVAMAYRHRSLRVLKAPPVAARAGRGPEIANALKEGK